MSQNKQNFIALDTSSSTGIVTLFDQEEILYTESLTEKHAHGQLLCLAINKALDILKNNNKNLDAIFVGLGPGSFVGLRISLATALGFCFGRKISLMGFCSHRAMAYSEFSDLNNIYIATKASGDLCYLTSFESSQTNYKLASKSNILELAHNNLITNLELENSHINIINSQGPTSVGIQRACLYKLKQINNIIDESDYIKPNYIKSPSVSIPKIFNARQKSLDSHPTNAVSL